MILEQTAARQTKLLSLLRREFGLSAGLVKRLKWQNALFVNGAPAHTDAPVTPGDRVRVVLEERTEGFDPEPLPLSILYEDECFLAVDKPSGMLVHPSPQKNSGTLANGVLYHLLERGEAGLPGADLVLLLRGERLQHSGKGFLFPGLPRFAAGHRRLHQDLRRMSVLQHHLAQKRLIVSCVDAAVQRFQDLIEAESGFRRAAIDPACQHFQCKQQAARHGPVVALAKLEFNACKRGSDLFTVKPRFAERGKRIADGGLNGWQIRFAEVLHLQH